jgi:hypothetical protein
MHNDVNNPSFLIHEDLQVVESGGTLNYIAGDGTIEFDGSSVTINFANVGTDPHVMEQMRFDLAGSCLANSDFGCSGFIGIAGDFDLAGYVCRSIGAVEVDPPFRFHNGVDEDMSDGAFDIDIGLLRLYGEEANPLVIDDLDFDLADGVPGIAYWCEVEGSYCTYGTSGKINATTRCIDNGGNVGWYFLPGTRLLGSIQTAVRLNGEVDVYPSLLGEGIST